MYSKYATFGRTQENPEGQPKPSKNSLINNYMFAYFIDYLEKLTVSHVKIKKLKLLYAIC